MNGGSRLRRAAAPSAGFRSRRLRVPAALAVLAVALACGREPPPPAAPAAAASEPSTPAPPPAEAAVRTLALTPGATVEDELAGGEAHVYRLELAAGQYADLVVDQRGIDVAVSLFDADGRRLTRVDTPNGSRGPEPLPLVGEGGELRMEVRASSRLTVPGRYAVIVEELRPATGRHRERLAAERAFAEAEALRRRQDGESRRRAITAYRRLRDVFDDLGDHRRRADVDDRLGRVHLLLGETAPAAAAYERALPVFRELGARLEAGNALNGLGMAYRRLGESEKAVVSYRQALEIHRALGLREAESNTLNNLGRIYDLQGKVQEALESYEQALEIKRALGARVNAAETLGNLGSLHASLGDHERALELLGEALETLDAAGQIRQTAVTLLEIGRVHGEAGQPEEEVRLLRRALPMLRETGDRNEEALALHNLGWAYIRLRRFEPARRAFTQALAVFRELGAKRGQAHALANLGWLDNELGRHDAAVDSFRQALKLSTAVGDPQSQAAVLFGLARARRGQGYLAASRTACEDALKHIEALRTEPGSQQLRYAFFASKQDYYRFYVDLLMELHQRQPGAGHDARAFEASERTRARTLLDLVPAAGADPRRDADPDLLAREEEVGRRLNAVERRRLELEHDGAPAEVLAAAEKQKRRLLALWERLEAEVRQVGGRRAQPTLPAPLPAEEIQRQLLNDETLLLEYALGAERSFLWAVTPDSVTSFVLPPQAEIETTARRAHALLATRNRTLARGRAAAALAELSRLLLAPVADRLAGRRLLVIPDGALHYVPFAALSVPATAGGSDPVPLVAEHEILSFPSASSLAELRRQGSERRPTATIAVVADPVFSAADPRLGARHGSPRPSAERSAEPLRWRRLPFSRAEAEAILALVPKAERLGALGFAARREAVTGGELGRYGILHFATHGFLDFTHPELSGIVLSMYDEAGRPRDGFLRAHEIYRLDLAADLVVLSACQTALGKEVRGEGMIGLTRAFLAAGARRFLVSLWPVEDRATAELMRHFYRALLIERQGPAAALRAAQMAVRRHHAWRDPYYWAGFVLHGDG